MEFKNSRRLQANSPGKCHLKSKILAGDGPTEILHMNHWEGKNVAYSEEFDLALNLIIGTLWGMGKDDHIQVEWACCILCCIILLLTE